MAAQNGHLSIVKLLLNDPRVDPTAEDNYPLRKSAANGHIKVVEELLKDPRVDPSCNNFYAYFKSPTPQMKKLILNSIMKNKSVLQKLVTKSKMNENKHLILF